MPDQCPHCWRKGDERNGCNCLRGNPIHEHEREEQRDALDRETEMERAHDNPEVHY